jgi:NADH dehydrogenase
VTGRKRAVIGLPGALATLMAWKLEHLPGPLMSRDNLLSMQVPSVCECELPFEIAATPLEAAAPLYLLPSGPRSHYTGFRDHAGR